MMGRFLLKLRGQHSFALCMGFACVTQGMRNLMWNACSSLHPEGICLLCDVWVLLTWPRG